MKEKRERVRSQRIKTVFFPSADLGEEVSTALLALIPGAAVLRSVDGVAGLAGANFALTPGAGDIGNTLDRSAVGTLA